VSGTTVELPREIGALLRREVGPLGPLHPGPPTPDAPERSTDSVDSAGAGQVMEVVRHTEALLDALGGEPAPALKSGGLGVRDLRRLARSTGLPEAGTAVLVEITAAVRTGRRRGAGRRGALRAQRGRAARVHRARRPDVVRAGTPGRAVHGGTPGPGRGPARGAVDRRAGGHRCDRGSRPAAPAPGRPRADPGRPDRRRTRTARARPGRRAVPGRRTGVGQRLPDHRRRRAPGARRRVL